MIIIYWILVIPDLCTSMSTVMKSLRILPVVLVLATACTATDHTPGPLQRDTGYIGVISELPQQPQGPIVTLDSGKRWKANPETSQGIRSMLMLVERYPQSGLTKLQLKDTLEAEFQMIFEKCTMTGEGHNQLHNYLIPLHKMLGGMSDKTTDAEIMTMHAHLQTYGEYFE
jgi:hypothetical protein